MIAALTRSLSARCLPHRALPSMGALSLTHPLVQAAIYAVGLLATKAVSFVMLPFITGYLPPAEFGRLEVMVAIADIASVVLGMGLLDALFRFASASNGTREGRSTNRSAAARIFGLSLLLGVGFGATGLALAPTLTSIFPGASETLHLRLILATVSLEGAIQIPLAWLRMTDRPVMYLALSVGKAVLQAILTLSFLEMGMGVTGVLLAGTIAAASLGAILVLQQSRATGVSFRLKGAGSILRYSAPLVLSGIAGFLLGGFDRIVLADALGAEAMALYALAAKFALLAGLMLSPLSLWWMPRRFAMLNQPDGVERSGKIVTYQVIAAIAVGAFIALTSPIAITLMTPTAYHGAIVIVPWLVLAQILKFAGDTMNVGCYTGSDTVGATAIGLGSAGVIVVLYLVLVPQLGIDGALIAANSAWFLRFIVFLAVSQRRTTLPYGYRKLVAASAVAIALVISAPALATLGS